MRPSPSKRILVAGCGAVGSVFGCLLREAGHDVTLLGRKWHLDAIRACGLRMNGIWSDHFADGFRLSTEPAELSDSFDLILIAVKAHDTCSMVGKISSLLKTEGIALSLQNGLDNIETLAGTFGAARSLGSSILVGAKISEPANVTVTVQAAPIVIGPLDSETPASMKRTLDWVDLLRRAGIPCEATDQILSHLWAKVFYNAPLNPLGALLQTHYGALGELPELRAVVDQIIEEAFQVAQKKEVRLLWASADDYRNLFYEKLLPATYDHKSSMLQDLERKRRTEIGALNGKIWQYGSELGVSTPYNEVMTRLILGKEKRLMAEDL